jgi:hypothetical protein
MRCSLLGISRRRGVAAPMTGLGADSPVACSLLGLRETANDRRTPGLACARAMTTGHGDR